MAIDQNYNFTDKELKFSYWYVTHKLLLRNIYIISLGLLCFVIWFYLIWQLVFFGIFYNVENYQLRKLVFSDNPGLATITQLTPKSLQIGDPVSLASEGDRVDYFAEVSNSNTDWLATFDYVFDGNGSDGNTRSGFALPQERKYLMNLGLDGPVSQLNISNLKWQRIGNAQSVYNERYQFRIENNDFIAGSKADDPSILTFDIINDSAFNYWQVGVQAFLYSGGNVASVNYIVLEQLKSGEKRHVQLNWSNKLPRISNIEIIPEVNIFDDNNIMPQDAPADLPITL